MTLSGSASPVSSRAQGLLAVTSRHLGDTAVLVTVSGEIDAATSPLLDAEFETVLQPSLPRTIVVDLSGVTFMSGSGITSLLDVHNRMQAAGGALRLFGLSRVVKRPLELTGMMKVFDIHYLRATALAGT